MMMNHLQSTRDQCDLEIEGGAGLSTDISLLSRYLMSSIPGFYMTDVTYLVCSFLTGN